MQTFVSHLIGLSIVCFVMCFIFLASESSIGTPVGLAFSTMGMVAGFTAAGLKHVNKRLDKIDERSRDFAIPESEKPAEQDAGARRPSL